MIRGYNAMPQQAMPSQFSIPSADDTSFNRLVLKAALPTIAFFVVAGCEHCAACAAAFARLASRYQERVGVVMLDLDECPVIAESFGVQAAPAYLLFRDGEPIAYGLGYIPDALLETLFQEAVEPAGAWPPTEQRIEDVLILPLLRRWGWSCRRQYQLTRRGAHTRRGAVDILVALDELAPPLTLFENKRRIADAHDLRRAVEQAHGYARALELAVFVVADAARLWVYAAAAEDARLLQQFTWLDLERDDAAFQALLLASSAVPE